MIHYKTGNLLEANAEALVNTMDKDGQTQRIRAKFVVNASERDTFLSNHFHMKHRNKKHNSAAIYGHFSGVKRLEGEVEGNIESAASVELLSTGVLNGDLKGGTLTVAAGSRMRGRMEFGWEPGHNHGNLHVS